MSGEAHFVPRQQGAEFAEVLDDEVGRGGAELREFVVAREDGHGMDAAVLRGLDVVRHVADEDGGLRVEAVLGEELLDDLPLVPDAGVRPVNEPPEIRARGLGLPVVGMHRAQEKRPHAALAAEDEKLARVRQRLDEVLHFAEAFVKPFLQLHHRHAGQVAVVEGLERQAELGAELVEGQLRFAGGDKDMVGGAQHGGQVIHQRARPIKDDVLNHARGDFAEAARGCNGILPPALMRSAQFALRKTDTAHEQPKAKCPFVTQRERVKKLWGTDADPLAHKAEWEAKLWRVSRGHFTKGSQ